MAIHDLIGNGDGVGGGGEGGGEFGKAEEDMHHICCKGYIQADMCGILSA